MIRVLCTIVMGKADPTLTAILRAGVCERAFALIWPVTVRHWMNLFSWNKDPFAARIAADGWLRIFASEGHGASNCLRAESILRVEDMHFTHASVSSVGYDGLSKHFLNSAIILVYLWDWWIDPTSSISLLREEGSGFQGDGKNAGLSHVQSGLAYIEDMHMGNGCPNAKQCLFALLIVQSH